MFPTPSPRNLCYAGVYAGSMYSEYMQVIMAGTHIIPPLAVVGSGLSHMVGRISYTFNFTGVTAVFLGRNGRCGSA